MTELKYELIGNNYSNTNQVPKGDDIYYRCTNCGGIILSVSEVSVGCTCGKVSIDIDYLQLRIWDYDTFEVLQLVR